MKKAVAATEVKNRFGHVLRQVDKSGGPIVIERDGKPVAVLISIDAYERLQRQDGFDTEDNSLLDSAFGMWGNRSEIDDTWLSNGRLNWKSDWQDE